MTATGHTLLGLAAVEADREVLDAADEVRTQAVRCGEALDPLDPAHELLEQHVDLHAGELRAEAEVRPTTAERDVGVRVACDVERERVVPHVLVAVARDVPEADLVAGLDGVLPQLEVLR